MPTGYTAKLVDKGQSFEEFVWTCARAFGALVDMRDDGLDAPIPETLSGENYYATKLKKHQAELDEALAMDEAQRLSWGEARKRETIDGWMEAEKRNTRERDTLNAMIAKVKEWTPPSDEHAGMKKFMLEQLRDSLPSGDWWTEYLKESRARTPLAYFAERLDALKRRLAEDAKEAAKENEHAANRNKWLADLRASVPIPAHMLAKK